MGQVFYASMILLPLGISMRMSLRLLYGARGPQVSDPIYQIMSVLSWILALIPLLILILAGTSWLSLLLLLIAVLAIIELVLARREAQRRSAWALLNGEVSNTPPSVEALRSHQYRFSGIVGRSFRKLVNSLKQGTSLLTAVGQHRRALPREAQAYASIGAVNTKEAANASEKITKQQTELATWTQNAITQRLYQRFYYLAIVVMVMVGIVTFLMKMIIPSYVKIFEDFGLELPGITKLLIVTTSSPLVLILLNILSFIFLALMLLGVLVFLLYLCDIAALRPIADRMFFSRHRAFVLQLFSIGIQQGKSFENLLKQLAHGDQCYPSGLVRRRLSKMLRYVASGEDWKNALCRTSFIKAADIPVLETAQQAGNLTWVLRFLANQKVRLMAFRWSVIEQFVFPIAIIGVGCLVLFICAALFIPLVELIYDLTW